VTDNTLASIPVFVEVVACGSFAGAAQRLHLTRSAVGKTIARLEARLGTRLFHRTTRQQGLTEDGQAFYEYCQRALAELKAGEAVLEGGHKEVKGRLRVTAPVLFGRYCVAPLLHGLIRDNPGLEVQLTFSDTRLDLLEQGYDLAVRSGEPTEAAGLATRLVTQQITGIFAAPDYLARHGTPQSAAELMDHTTILYDRRGQTLRWAVEDETAPEGRHLVEPRSRFRLDDLEAIADAAAAGLGLALLPTWLAASRVGDGSLVQVMPVRAGAKVDIRLLWPQTPAMPLRLRTAIDLLVRGLPGKVGAVRT
jgi:DNA-binding transcriptional LysR family regulator